MRGGDWVADRASVAEQLLRGLEFGVAAEDERAAVRRRDVHAEHLHRRHLVELRPDVRPGANDFSHVRKVTFRPSASNAKMCASIRCSN